jgi:hypothetical protein
MIEKLIRITITNIHDTSKGILFSVLVPGHPEEKHLLGQIQSIWLCQVIFN